MPDVISIRPTTVHRKMKKKKKSNIQDEEILGFTRVLASRGRKQQ